MKIGGTREKRQPGSVTFNIHRPQVRRPHAWEPGGGEGQETGLPGIGQEARLIGGKGTGRKEVRFANGS